MSQDSQQPPNTRAIRRSTALPLRIALVLVLAALAAAVWVLGPPSLSQLIPSAGEAATEP